MLQLVHIQIECALVVASHGYILGAHVNTCTLHNNAMLNCTPIFEYYIARLVLMNGHWKDTYLDEIGLEAVKM